MSERLAVLLTDVVDSTRLGAELGDRAMAAHWDVHHRAVRDLLRRWHGREIERTDGILAVFATASSAANCAVEYHRALTRSSLPFKARAAIHVGPVTLHENSDADVAVGAHKFEASGLAIIVVARVMATASGGQTLMTSDARAALGASELRVMSHGHWRFKGFDEPQEVFEIGGADSAFIPPPDNEKAHRVVRIGELWQPVRSVRNSLPAERDSFVGRHSDLEQLSSCVASARLVSILGLGGVGKTRFAIRYGWTWIGDFPGGVWFCDLSQARTLDGLLHAVGEGLELPLALADPVVQIGDSIAGRGECLVILDNFEQVASLADTTLGRWLERAPKARFIVTSREVLGIPGETAYSLAPLDTNDAADLFVRRAEAAERRFGADGIDRTSIERLAGLLDGLPLAIELAAARVRAMTPRELLARMDERFALLTSRRGRRDRQATLRATLDWSWDLLSVSERAALAQSSVFEGTFTTQAFEAVVKLPDGAPAERALDVLQSLVEKSLVRRRSERRFDLIPTVKEYAAEHLRSSDPFARDLDATAGAQRRHFDFYSKIADTDAKQEVLAEACADVENLVIACRRAVASADPRCALGTLDGAWAVLRLRGPFRTGVELAELVAGMPQLSRMQSARVGRLRGWALRQSGRTGEALMCFNDALGAAREVDDSTTERRVLSQLGALHVEAGRMDEARATLDRALSLARAANDASVQCEAMCELGNLKEHLGDAREARAFYEQSLAVAEATDDRHWQGGIHGNLGLLCSTQGAFDEARTHYEIGLAIARELGDRRWEGNALCNLGLLHHSQGRTAEARTTLEDALKIAREMGYVRLGGFVMCNLGIACEALGATNDAQSYYERAVAVVRELDDRRSTGQFLNYLGLLHARHNRFAQAGACLDEGENLLTEVGDKFNLGILLCSKAEAHWRTGHRDLARAVLDHANLLQQEISAPPDSEFGQCLQRASQAMQQSAVELSQD